MSSDFPFDLTFMDYLTRIGIGKESKNRKMLLIYYVLNSALILIAIFQAATGQSLTNAIHRTQAAIERVNDLWCYDCDTMDNGDACAEVVTTNTSAFKKKCKGEEFICMVKRFSYTTSTENSTSSPKMWSLERRCVVGCEPGCIVIGERTKLYACTSCCEKSLCNIGRGAAASTFHRIETGIGTILTLMLHFLLIKTYQAYGNFSKFLR